jgi:tetrahydromethanopterin S-methyltransferase subunit B
MTEEDFENVEDAMLVIEGWGNQDRSIKLTASEQIVYEFARKVLTETRQGLMTGNKIVPPLEERVEDLETLTANLHNTLERLCKILARK